MADEAKTVTAQRPVPGELADTPHAPFVVFDAVATQGTLEGMIMITLVALRQLPGEGTSVNNHPVVTAYLRTSLAGAVALQDSLKQAIAMAMPTPEGPPN